LETVLAVPALRAAVEGLDDEERHEVLAAVGRLLGVALAPVVSALNVAELLLSGPTDVLDGPLREAAERTIRARTMPVTGSGLEIQMATLREDVVLAGAAVLVLSGQLGIS
jgi:predicted NBD/HSP70 family sugar kinase